jgi:hypothetical protein
MMQSLENRIVALAADLLTARANLTVAGGPAAAPAAGERRLTVALADFVPTESFSPEMLRRRVTPPEEKRVLPVRGRVRMAFAAQPTTAAPANVAAARALLLEDMSLTGHGFSRPEFVDGRVFDTNEDQGFRVLSFALEAGEAASSGSPLSAELFYSFGAELWPPGILEPVSVTRGISRIATPLPLPDSGDEHSVRAGETVTLTVAGLAVERPAAAGQPSLPLNLAVVVLSSAPPAARGVIENGTAAAEAGVRLVSAAPGSGIVYRAPALAQGERLEYVAVHYATPDDKRGSFLATFAMRVKGGA